jgi:glucokinase
MRAARFDERFTLLDRAEAPTAPELGVGSIIERLIALTRSVIPPAETPHGIGVAAPGPLDSERGLILNPPNLPFNQTPIRDLLADALGVPVAVGNDADLAALGEHRLGAGRGTRHMVYLTVSTGIGGGLILNGELYTGAGQAGEAGFVIVAPGDPISGPGREGYIEPIASGTGLARRAREALEGGRDSLIRERVGGNLEAITGKIVGEAARAGDPLAREIVESAGEYLGYLITSLAHLIHPECVVIGGSVAGLGDLLFAPVRRTLAARIVDPVYAGMRVLPAALGEDGGLVGAAIYAAEGGIS